MRVSELYEQVAGLGFETSLDDGNDRFYQAAGRALLQINALRPDYKLYLRRYPYIPAWDLNLICV